MHEVVEPPEELDGLQVFPPAEGVGNPLARGARVVQVEHRGHRVHAQAVHVEALAPEQRIGQQEIRHLVPPVVEDQGAPVLVRSLARVFMFVQRRAVKAGQRPVVAREVRRHPVDNHPDPRRVQRIDEVLQVFRRAIAAGRREESRHLVAPGRVVSVFGDRHEFDMREAHLLHVLDQGLGQGAVAGGFRRRFLPPGAQVQLVDAQRGAQRIARPPPRQPVRVGPRELAVVPHNGRVLRGRLEEEAIGVGFEHDFPPRVAELELIVRPGGHVRHEDFPHPRLPQRPHRVAAAVPVVEVAHHADAPGVGRPNRETGAGGAVQHAQLRPEFIVDAALVALAEQEQIVLAEGGGKGVRVAAALRAALGIRDDQLVGVGFRHRRRHALEQARRVQARQREDGLVRFAQRVRLDFHRLRHQRPHHQAGAVGQRVHSQPLMGGALFGFHQTLEFCLCQKHGGWILAAGPA